MTSTALVIVTFLKDAEWLRFCLRSINKFASGFLETVVIIPERDAQAMSPMILGHGAKLKTFNEAPAPLGHLHHCAIKCSADLFTEADHVLYIDADCCWN